MNAYAGRVLIERCFKPRIEPGFTDSQNGIMIRYQGLFIYEDPFGFSIKFALPKDFQGDVFGEYLVPALIHLGRASYLDEYPGPAVINWQSMLQDLLTYTLHLGIDLPDCPDNEMECCKVLTETLGDHLETCTVFDLPISQKVIKRLREL